MSIFEQATKSGLRFKAANGQVSTEDLWSLSLAQLDVIARSLRKELREEDYSFIFAAGTASNAKTELMLEVVKRVIASKIEDRDAKAAAQDKAVRKQQILGVLEQKKSDSLQNMSVEDLEKELKNL